jgi:parvulin-like peptidyl-prolyl isomerase
MHKLRLALPILAVATLLAACGGGGGGSAKLDAQDVAVVGKRHITSADFNALMDQAKLNYKQQGQTFPKQGTTEYESLKSQAVVYLVQQAERQSAADALGVTVTDKQVQDRLAQVKQQCCQGNEKKYQAELKQAHLTDAQLRRDVRMQLTEQQVETQVTKNVGVSDADAHAYYNQHRQVYTQGPTRDVQYMLIKSKSLAQSLYRQLKSGNAKTWCTLAKKYSQDPSSKNNCGKATFTKGQTVKAFDTVLFSQPTGVVHAPVYDSQQYKAWFIIRPLSAVRPKSVTPYSAVSASIKQTLLQQKRTDALNTWATNLQKSFCKDSKIKYQAGYQPSPDPCTSLTTTSATTT